MSDKTVVLIGGGHAHLEVLRRFARRPPPDTRLAVIAREVSTTYSGMLPGVIAGIYRLEQAQIDARRLAEAAGARFHVGEVTGIDADARRVQCRDGATFAYDLLSINIGSTPATRSIPGAADHALPVKPFDRFLADLEAARRRIIAADGRARIGVVGGGAGGVELMLSLQRRLTRDMAEAGLAPTGLAFTLITASADILPGFPARMRRRFAALMHERGIAVLTGAQVAEVRPGAVLVEGVGSIGLDHVLLATQPSAPGWLAGTGLALDGDGFIAVTDTLQSVSHADVLAAGDIASVRGYPTPRSGVFAVRAGPALAGNLVRLLARRRPVRHRPQRGALYLISTGERYALGARNGLTVEGAWVWTLKDGIDRRFVSGLARAARIAPQPAGGQ